MSDTAAYYPGQVPIDAYGNGGFRFAGLSHRGSLLVLPSGIYAWDVTEPPDLSPGSFDLPIRETASADFLLLGTGRNQCFPDAVIEALFASADLGLEVMDTGAACRTYNLMLEEKRAVMAALIAVD